MDNKEIINLKELFERILTERDARYLQMFSSSASAVSTALAAQEKAVTAAFEASEKAIVKAEIAQTAYNERSNEFRATLDDQAKSLLPRSEADARFQQLRELVDSQAKLIVELQKSQSRGEGGDVATDKDKSTTQWSVGLIAAIAISLFSGIGSLIMFLASKH